MAGSLLRSGGRHRFLPALPAGRCEVAVCMADVGGTGSVNF